MVQGNSNGLHNASWQMFAATGTMQHDLQCLASNGTALISTGLNASSAIALDCRAPTLHDSLAGQESKPATPPCNIHAVCTATCCCTLTTMCSTVAVRGKSQCRSLQETTGLAVPRASARLHATCTYRRVASMGHMRVPATSADTLRRGHTGKHHVRAIPYQKP